MRVSFICGYYSDLAKNRARRPESYWDAYFFTWGVKVGSFKKPFILQRDDGHIHITAANFSLVRQSFGQFIASEIDDRYSGSEPLLVPIPSKDRLAKVRDARSTQMVQEAMSTTRHSSAVSSSVRWTQKVAKAHQGGPRGRAELRKYLESDTKIKGRNVILIDDLVSTGGSMLACKDVLEGIGATVIGAITCGKTVYDFNTPPFAKQEFQLTDELSDFH